MSDFNDWNKQTIAEFRSNGGKVGGQFEGAPLLLLHTTGAKSGEGETRERLWSRQKELYPGFAEYEAKTTRQIPVVILEPEA